MMRRLTSLAAVASAAVLAGCASWSGPAQPVSTVRSEPTYQAADASVFLANSQDAINKLTAQAGLLGRPVTLEFAQETLRDLLRAQQQAISIPNIQKTVADYYGLQIKDLLSKRRTRSLARPRQVAMALTKELTEHSLPEIGDAFAGRDHTTVLHACRQIRTLMETDGKLREDWDKLIRKLSE